MAFTKIGQDVAIPRLGDKDPDPEARADDLWRWGSMLTATLGARLSLIINAVNDLVDGNLSVLKLQVLFSAPVGPQDGWVVFADGTSWNPGSGKGFYGYYSGAWHKIV